MGRIVRLVQVLGVNSVPAFGVLAADWSAATALALYWCENVLIVLLVGLRLWLHRRATGKRGHWEAPGASGTRRSRGGSYHSEFLGMALVFTMAHGLFLGLLLFAVLPQEFPEAGGVDPAALLRGFGVVTVILLLGFCYDLIDLSSRSFAWVKRLADMVLGRVVLVHLTIIFGMVGMSWLDGPRGLFFVFAGFKTLSDLTSMTASGRPAESNEPPGCLMVPMRAFFGSRKARDFERHYRTQVVVEKRDEDDWEKRREE